MFALINGSLMHLKAEMWCFSHFSGFNVQGEILALLTLKIVVKIKPFITVHSFEMHLQVSLLIKLISKHSN